MRAWRCHARTRASAALLAARVGRQHGLAHARRVEPLKRVGAAAVHDHVAIGTPATHARAPEGALAAGEVDVEGRARPRAARAHAIERVVRRQHAEVGVVRRQGRELAGSQIGRAKRVVALGCARVKAALSGCSRPAASDRRRERKRNRLRVAPGLAGASHAWPRSSSNVRASGARLGQSGSARQMRSASASSSSPTSGGTLAAATSAACSGGSGTSGAPDAMASRNSAAGRKGVSASAMSAVARRARRGRASRRRRRVLAAVL